MTRRSPDDNQPWLIFLEQVGEEAKAAAERQRNDAFRHAFWLGYQAAAKGADKSDCPYRDLRTRRGNVTYARAFRRAWHEGWEHGRGDRPGEEQRQ